MYKWSGDKVSKLRTINPRHIFITLTISWTLLLIVMPWIEEQLAFIISTNFMRFVNFWFLGICMLFSCRSAKHKTWKNALKSCLLCIIPVLIYTLMTIHFDSLDLPQRTQVLTILSDSSSLLFGDEETLNLILDCLIGSSLGSLAGTWAKYIYEVYNTQIIDA